MQWRFLVIYRRLNNNIFARFYKICRICGKFIVFLTLNGVILNAYNFEKCKEFYLNTSQTFTLQNGTQIRAIHIGDGKYLAFSKNISDDFMKYDTFLHLILFKGENINQKYDFIPPQKLAKNATNLVAITDSDIIKGNILQYSKSLKTSGIFSQKMPQNAVISDICYQAYGISIGEDRFIDSAYIERFLQDKDDKIYSDIGFSVKSLDNKIIANSINPFAVPTSANKNSLQIGDEILFINGIKIRDENDFFDISSNLDLAQTATIVAKRNEVILTIHTKPFKRERAFDDRGTTLDFFGIIIDDNLIVQRVPPNRFFQKYDKILRLNQIKISNKFELDSAILQVLENEWDFSFLIRRNDFEFFLTIPNGASFE